MDVENERIATARTGNNNIDRSRTISDSLNFTVHLFIIHFKDVCTDLIKLVHYY